MSGTIPYIWGGCSLTETLRTGRFRKITIKRNDKLCDAYQQTEIKEQPQSGLDCTGLIMRAAQTSGLPYYYKNSTTIAHYLKPITSLENIQEGDLIWIPGHIMAISDLKRNMIIEARHYNDGYGKIHEIKLNHLFKDIQTFADLYNAIAHHQPLLRLNREGKVSKTIMHAKILSLDSCY
jgi:cell wall-associated NlpC family hydrolase